MRAVVGKGSHAWCGEERKCRWLFLFGENVLKVEWSRPVRLDRCTGQGWGVRTDAPGWTSSPLSFLLRITSAFLGYIQFCYMHSFFSITFILVNDIILDLI
jgi:hypothetical protein